MGSHLHAVPRHRVRSGAGRCRITLYRPSEEPMSADPSITISFPARAEFVRVARLAATGVVSIADWTVDDVEDFRLAVSEACAHLLSPPGEASQLTVEITLRGREADVIVSANVDEPANGRVPETLARE